MFETDLVGKRIHFPARLDLINGVRAQFGDFLRELRLKTEDIDLWELVLSESLSNAVVHGSNSDPSKSVEVQWSLSNRRVTVMITDTGKGPGKYVKSRPKLPVDPLNPGGRGLYLISRFCDILEHWTGSHGYRQVLIKKHDEIDPAKRFSGELIAALEEITQCYESLAAFYKLGDTLIQSESVSSFLDKAISDLRPVIEADFISLCFSEDLLEVLRDEINSLAVTHVLQPDSVVQKEVLDSTEEFIWESASEAPSDPLLKAFRCGFCCPIKAGGDVIGIIVVAREKDTPYLNAGELNTVRTFADLIGIAVANAQHELERTNELAARRDLEIAAEIQQTLLPTASLPETDRYKVFVKRVSARLVAGDYVEACVSKDGDLVLATVDVMGKGVSAAFLGVMFRTALHMNLNKSMSLDTLINSLNSVLCHEVGELTMFATCSLALIPPSMDRIEMVNAGHCPVVLIEGDRVVRLIEPSGPPLGLFETSEYEIEHVSVNGDTGLLMVTDGVYEWEGGGNIWSWEKFLDFLRQNLPLSPDNFWNTLQGKIQASLGGSEMRDDQSILYWESKK